MAVASSVASWRGASGAEPSRSRWLLRPGDGRGGPRAGAARARSRAYRDAYTVSTCIVIVE